MFIFKLAAFTVLNEEISPHIKYGRALLNGGGQTSPTKMSDIIFADPEDKFHSSESSFGAAVILILDCSDLLDNLQFGALFNDPSDQFGSDVCDVIAVKPVQVETPSNI